MCGLVAVACRGRYIPIGILSHGKFLPQMLLITIAGSPGALDIVHRMAHWKLLLTSGRLQVRRKLSSFFYRHQMRKMRFVVRRWANSTSRAQEGSSRANRMISRRCHVQLRTGFRCWAAAFLSKQVRILHMPCMHA